MNNEQTQWERGGELGDQQRVHTRRLHELRCWVDAACRPVQECEVHSPRSQEPSTPTTLQRTDSTSHRPASQP